MKQKVSNTGTNNQSTNASFGLLYESEGRSVNFAISFYQNQNHINEKRPSRILDRPQLYEISLFEHSKFIKILQFENSEVRKGAGVFWILKGRA